MNDYPKNNWVMDTYYPNYNIFLELFNKESYSFNLPHGDGGAKMYANPNLEYPIDIDPSGEYIEFVKKSVSDYLPLTDIKLSECWWLDYPPKTYSGIHQHKKGQLFTTVLFLDSDATLPHLSEPGCLFAFTVENNVPVLHEWEPDPGKLIILDGHIYHGNYPTQFKRNVLVCDFTYNIGGRKE